MQNHKLLKNKHCQLRNDYRQRMYVAFNSQRLVVNSTSMTRIFSELTPCCMVTHKLPVAHRHDELTTLLLPRRLLSQLFLWCTGLSRSVLGHEPSSDEIRLVRTVNAGLRRRSAADRLLRLWVRIPTGAWMFVVSVVFCQVEICALGGSLVQRNPTDCGVSLCVI